MAITGYIVPIGPPSAKGQPVVVLTVQTKDVGPVCMAAFLFKDKSILTPAQPVSGHMQFPLAEKERETVIKQLTQIASTLNVDVLKGTTASNPKTLFTLISDNH